MKIKSPPLTKKLEEYGSCGFKDEKEISESGTETKDAKIKVCGNYRYSSYEEICLEYCKE